MRAVLAVRVDRDADVNRTTVRVHQIEERRRIIQIDALAEQRDEGIHDPP